MLSAVAAMESVLLLFHFEDYFDSEVRAVSAGVGDEYCGWMNREAAVQVAAVVVLVWGSGTAAR